MLYVYRFLWPLPLGWLLVCCLYKEVYLHFFKCVSFWLHGCWRKWECYPVNQASWVAVVTPTDRSKSVHNRCVIELFSGLFVLSLCPFDISAGIGACVTGLSQMTSFFFKVMTYVINTHKKEETIGWNKVYNSNNSELTEKGVYVVYIIKRYHFKAI